MPLRLFVLVNIAVVMTLSVAFSEGANHISSDQIERPIMMRQGIRAFLPGQDAMSLVRSPSLFFLHLLKHKLQIQKLEKITTTTTTTTVATPTMTNSSRICICVPFYQCDANQTIITDGTGVIDVRFRRCPGPFDVCCYLPNITIPTPPMTRPPTTMSTTRRPSTVFPTGPPNLNCICVDISLCDPNGIVTISGEGIINPRGGYRLCPGANRVCCTILATTSRPTNPPTSRPTTMTPAPTMTTLPPGQIQLCFVCGNTIQCITCGVIITPGAIDPRFPLSQSDLCSRSLTNEPLCQDGTMSSSVEVLGPLKNLGTPQACYCIKTWMCSEDNVVNPDGLGVIDSRFTTCSSEDQVCCRSTGMDVQILRSGDTFLSSPERFIANNPSSSFSQTICGIRDASYASSQPFPADSENTYFAEFPWMVALLAKSATGSYTFQCGASMINDRAVLTAAHCVVNQKPENLIARFGQWDIEDKTQPLPVQEANILAIVIHPTYYSGGLFHDIAVLVLEKPVVYSTNILPICLPEQGMVFTAGTRCYGTGWGSSSLGPEGKYQAELRKVNVPIVDHAECQTRLRSTRLGQHFQLHGSFICAGGEANRDTCRGDGGGPLTCQSATGQFLQAGIVSWGIGCGASNVPAAYTSVSQHRQWIDKQLATYGVQ
ncbi:serine protease persephone-like [Odontomachus brunneus]|uniref:serine protease persephone-like n=1 Tax=Odontomachus brunneus TaxID=486640 RepID=UPI0013F1A12D|nr:serine protease persephone-like [Odontomachus brunneus]